MLNEKLLEVLSHPADGIVAIVTQGKEEPHVVNTWNSYVHVLFISSTDNFPSF